MHQICDILLFAINLIAEHIGYFALDLQVDPTNYLTALPNSGGSQLTLVSQCESRYTMTSPITLLPPFSLVRINKDSGYTNILQDKTLFCGFEAGNIVC